MPDIFNRSTDSFGGSFAADAAKVTFPALVSGGSDAGLLVQNMNASYSQQITRLYEVGSPSIYYVGGRTQGQASIARVVGPRKIAAGFYTTYGDVCNASSNSLHFSMTAGCGLAAGSRASYTCHFVVITQIGLSVTSQDMLINENVAMMFSSFLYN
jgi:hypothetical protein